MRTLTADLFCTVDGFAAGTQSPAYFGYDGPELAAWIAAETARPHEILMGATTYRTLAEIRAADDADTTGMDHLPKIVVSSTLRTPLAWPGSTLLSGPIAETVPRLKAAPGDPLRLIGSLTLLRGLLTLGLVDRLRLLLFPQILGTTGREPILTDLPDLNLDLRSSTVLDGRLVLLEYAPAGPVTPAAG